MLITPVPIFQHESEFQEVLDMYVDQQPLSLLEIGTYHGGTLYHWVTNAPRGATIVSVDTFTAADNRHLFDEWIPDGVTLHFVEGDSRDPKTVAKVKEILPTYEWVFIDADHYEDAVRDDWNNYGKLATSKVLFHDILTNVKFHPEIQVERVWRDIRGDSYQEIVENHDNLWGGIGVLNVEAA